MSTIAERIYAIVRELPESKAAEILDFAEFVKARESAGRGDFFALAGLWAGRDIDEESLRAKAWPELRM